MSTAAPKVQVLFVCMGNICRSPTGEGVFRRYVEDHGYAHMFHVDSAGTTGYHVGEPADFRMTQAAVRHGYLLESVARQVTSEDLRKFDLVVAMDHQNYLNLRRLAEGATENIRMLGSFLPGQRSDRDAPSVPDPYYGGAQGFEDVIAMIEDACSGILSHCLNLFPSR